MIGIVYPISEVDVIQALSTHGGRRSILRAGQGRECGECGIPGGGGGGGAHRAEARAAPGRKVSIKVAPARRRLGAGVSSVAAPTVSESRVKPNNPAWCIGGGLAAAADVEGETRTPPAEPASRGKKVVGNGVHVLWPTKVHRWLAAAAAVEASPGR